MGLPRFARNDSFAIRRRVVVKPPLNRTIAAATLLLLARCSLFAADSFSFAQIQYPGAWDSRPRVFPDIYAYLTMATSVKIEPQRPKIKLSDPELFQHPFLLLTGEEALPDFSDYEYEMLRRHIRAGGTLWVDDSSGRPGGTFDRSVKKLCERLFPDEPLQKIPTHHALYRSFYLLTKAQGRRAGGTLYGVLLDGRVAVIYSQMDVLGAWERDALGNYIYPCIPDGEVQRMEAMKLTVNIVLFALTGTYKMDTIHQSFINQKLR